MAGLLLVALVEDVTARLPLVLAGVQGLVNEAAPLARDLSSSDLPALVADLREEDLPALLASLRTSALPALESTGDLVADLSAGDRLARALVTTTSLLTEVAARQLPRRAVASSRDLLDVQRQTFDVLAQSLSVQRRTLSRVRSIDEKFGGQVTPLGG